MIKEKENCVTKAVQCIKNSDMTRVSSVFIVYKENLMLGNPFHVFFHAYSLRAYISMSFESISIFLDFLHLESEVESEFG